MSGILTYEAPVGNEIEFGGVFVDVLHAVDEGQDGLLEPGGVLRLKDYVFFEAGFAVGPFARLLDGDVFFVML